MMLTYRTTMRVCNGDEEGSLLAEVAAMEEMAEGNEEGASVVSERHGPR